MGQLRYFRGGSGLCLGDVNEEALAGGRVGY